MFFMIKTAGNRSIYTLNRVAVCGMLNYLNYTVFAEDIYNTLNSLFNKYVRREYFNTNMMCFAKDFKLHNSFVIILLNNIEMLLNYLKTLKGNFMQEYNDIFSDEKHTMVFSSIEELDNSNKKRYENLLKEKIKIIVEFLKLTVKFFVFFELN